MIKRILSLIPIIVIMASSLHSKTSLYMCNDLASSSSSNGVIEWSEEYSQAKIDMDVLADSIKTAKVYNDDTRLTQQDINYLSQAIHSLSLYIDHEPMLKDFYSNRYAKKIKSRKRVIIYIAIYGGTLRIAYKDESHKIAAEQNIHSVDVKNNIVVYDSDGPLFLDDINFNKVKNMVLNNCNN